MRLLDRATSRLLLQRRCRERSLPEYLVWLLARVARSYCCKERNREHLTLASTVDFSLAVHDERLLPKKYFHTEVRTVVVIHCVARPVVVLLCIIYA